MKPIAYYCDTTDSIDELIQQYGEFLQKLSQTEKVDLLHNLVSILWNLYEPWKVDTQPAEDAFNLVKGQSRQSLIELCTAIITYIQEGERHARVNTMPLAVVEPSAVEEEA